jgi:hypothetical protein
VRLRGAIGASGVLLGLYGAWLLVSRQEPGQLLEVVLWLAGGVLAHDVVLTAVLLLLGLLGTRLLSPAWRAPATVALVVWGGLTVVAVPVLGRFGARPDNPTLLDRPYLASWAVLTAITVVAVVGAGLVRSRRPAAARDGE